MKQLTLIMIAISSGISYSQTEQLDPRQYIEVDYSRNGRQHFVPIATYGSDDFFSQRFGLIDKKSVINIQFLIDSIANNTNFYGSISLSAEITGPKGTRSIEVNPYTLIGQEKTAFGIETISSLEFAKRLINMKLFLGSDSSSYYNPNFEFYNEYYIERLFYGDPFEFYGSDLESFVRKLESDSVDVSLEFRNQLKVAAKEEFQGQSLTVLNEIIDANTFRREQLFDELYRLSRKEEEKRSEEDRKIRLQNLFERQLNASSKMLKYLKSIEEAGDDAVRALMQLTNFDEIKFQNMIMDLEKMVEPDPALSSRQKELLTESTIVLLTDFSRSLAPIGNDPVPLAKKIAKTIYSKLVDARIDLARENAQEGEVLTICLLWDEAANEEEAAKLDLCRFDIDKTGPVPQVMDAFFLVDQINVKQPNIDSPSNFNGTAGVTLMLTHYRNHKYLSKFEPSVKPSGHFGIRTMNVLQPSIGLNVSYLDFSAAKDFEIGAGITVGLFRNQLMFTYGVNLHAITDISYFGIGFSFVNIANFLNEKID